MKLSIPSSLFTGQQVKRGEQRAAQLAGVEMYTLMQRAGGSAYDLLKRLYPQASRLLILVGSGNNGGDGFVVAKLAQADGMNVTVALYGDESKLAGDALKAKQEWLNCGGEFTSLESLDLERLDVEVVVDGLLGTGLSGDVRLPLQNQIERVNHLDLPTLSIDLPSGLCSDTGRVLGKAIRANHTITFIGVKQGLMTGQAREVTGQIHFAGLGVDGEFLQCEKASSSLLDIDEMRDVLPRRKPTAHKGHHGPGLGKDEWAQEIYRATVCVDKPKIVDADGLNLLAFDCHRDPLRIITPHPGEAARLLQCSVKQVEQDRFSAVRELQAKFGGVVVLKGAGTLVCDETDIFVCYAGNAGMATGGMGDVLTGIIAAMLAQGLGLVDAAKVGVLLHSAAADELAHQEGQIGLLASDVVHHSRTVLNNWLSD
ncbi:NAD(P)H-hydrate epimerase [Vibrio sp. Hep-1b-8]|uniref:NAD(P)H-hydrate epimerase n=1 Tax=Vibrio sp. Hep-1b-8 TaxID=2144187 RepID=UPI0011105906|nr:NAD(P)H-hydrate epimerase [Vibrio sp. Hep-1b-8]TMX33294.1 bifunctional ADP-dependent NAD(P)H-hydrate dehydratase/NAD(P)H-hydrate epimerase [Vibrio sp. Hep-1b-8]